MSGFFKSWKFKVLLALAIVLGAFMLHALTTGSSSTFFSQAAGFVSAPVLRFTSQLSEEAYRFFERYLLIEQVYEENETLREDLRELRDQLVDYETVKRENEQFREFLELKEQNPDYDFETATVIGRDSTSRFASFTIDKGSLAGVAVADPVISPDGLVGIIWEVGPTYAHVRTLLDTSLEVGVYNIRTRDSGIVTGDITLFENGQCQMRYIPRESGASAGDLIVTSGIGGVFPKDLVVGSIRSIHPEQSGISLYAVIDPAADIESVSDVLVIKYFSGQGTSVPEPSDGASSPESDASSSEPDESSDGDGSASEAEEGSAAQEGTP